MQLKDFWFITNQCEVSHKVSPKDDWPEVDKKWVEGFKECGNYFETKKEAEKAVEKLRAWKRLKDKGFAFNGWNWKYQKIGYILDDTAISEEDVAKTEEALYVLFEEEEK